MIELQDLVVCYGSLTAVDGLSLTIAEGARFGLLGPNGAGKTSTLACIAGLLAPCSGRVRVAGIDVASRPYEVRRVLGLVPQALALYPSLSVLENLRIFGGLLGLGGARLRERVGWALELAQLEPRRASRVEHLSGGMKRRLNLAASLLHDPKVIILDEPTTGVDPQSRNHIFDTIRRLQSDGATVVYTTHYMEEVEALCNEVAIIDHGRILAHDRLEKLLRRAGTSKRFLLELGKELEPDELRAALRCSALPVQRLEAQTRNLEEVFLELTGRQLREGD